MTAADPMQPKWGTFGPREVTSSLLLWAALIPLSALAQLVPSVAGIDTADIITAVLLVFCAAILLGLGIFSEPASKMPGRVFWLILAATFLILALGEFGVGPSSSVPGRFYPDWASGGICWLVLAWGLARLRHRRSVLGRAGLGLYSLGLAAQGAAILLLAWTSYPALADCASFVSADVYLLAFIMLAGDLSARRALLRYLAIVDSAAEPVAAIRAGHLAFASAMLGSDRFNRRRVVNILKGLRAGTLPSALWGAGAFTLKLGRATQRRTGKPLNVQFTEQVCLNWRYQLAPKAYYLFELYLPDRQKEARLYLQRLETKGSLYYALLRSGKQRLSDKLEFHDQCVAFGLPVAPVLLAAVNGRIEPAFASITALPRRDLFLKPRKGSGGRGGERWMFTQSGGDWGYRGKDGRILGAEELLQRVIELSRKEPLIVQGLLANDDTLSDINCGTLATVRILSCRNETGGFEVTDAAFRMPSRTGSAVDNFHAGGIASSVDIRSGTLGPATDIGLSPASAWFDRHPVTGAPISGRVLPRWSDAIRLAAEAHGHFDQFTVIGWDIALLAGGPCIIEANGAPDLDILQRTSRRPIGNARFGQLIAFNLRQCLRGSLPEAGA